MICPQSGSECNKKPCLDYGCCYIADDPPKPVECSDFNLFTSDRSKLAELSTYQELPTMAEIERLAGDVSLALSALLAAIRAYGEGK